MRKALGVLVAMIAWAGLQTMAVAGTTSGGDTSKSTSQRSSGTSELRNSPSRAKCLDKAGSVSRERAKCFAAKPAAAKKKTAPAKKPPAKKKPPVKKKKAPEIVPTPSAQAPANH